MKQSIAIVSEHYFPENNATGKILTEIAESLVGEFDVTVLTTQPPRIHSGPDEQQLSPKVETLNGVKVFRANHLNVDRGRLVMRALQALTATGSMASLCLTKLKPGMQVLSVTNPPTLPYIVRLITRMKRCRFYLLVHDVYPEVLVATGLLKKTSLATRFMGFCSGRLYQKSDKVIVIGRDMKRIVAPHRPPNDSDLLLIPNYGDDLTLHIPLDPDTQPDTLVVQHAGNMGRTHAIEAIVELAESCLKSGDSIRFDFVGSGSKKAWLEAEIASRQLTNVTVRPPIPRSEGMQFMAQCDVSVIGFVPGMAGASVPSRMYNVLASGRPILAITEPDSELALVVTEEAAGVVVMPGDPEALVSALSTLKASPTQRAELGVNGRKAYERAYTKAQAMQAFAELFRKPGKEGSE